MKNTTKPWFKVQNVANDPTSVDIQIIDLIGDWYDEMWKQFGCDVAVTAKSFVDALAKLPDTVNTLNVHINSPGGDVQAGVNIANALRAEVAKGRTVNTYVDGIAASIASVIAMAGSTVFIADNALMMIHNPYCLALGNAAEMRKTAEILDAMRGQIIATYQWHSTMKADAIASLMDVETWMDADQAIANGFATNKVSGLQAAASIAPKAMSALKVPEQFRDRVKAFLAPSDEVKVVTCDCATDCPCQNGGVCGENCATCKDSCGCTTSTEDSAKNLKTPPADSTQDAQPDAPLDALTIMELCEQAGCPEMAKALVSAKATRAHATRQIADAKAAKAAALVRSTEIRALCANAKLPEMADGYVNGGMTPADVRVHLTTVTAKLDVARIDAGLSPDESHVARSKSMLNVLDIYAARNASTKEK